MITDMVFAVISESLARERWPNRDPIGQAIEFGNMDGNLKPLTIVGIAGDVRARGLDFPPSPVIYVDYRQRGFNINSQPTILLRSTMPQSEIVSAARGIFHDFAPDAPVKFSSFDGGGLARGVGRGNWHCSIVPHHPPFVQSPHDIRWRGCAAFSGHSTRFVHPRAASHASRSQLGIALRMSHRPRTQRPQVPANYACPCATWILSFKRINRIVPSLAVARGYRGFSQTSACRMVLYESHPRHWRYGQRRPPGSVAMADYGRPTPRDGTQP
jgi:hypothetical protein